MNATKSSKPAEPAAPQAGGVKYLTFALGNAGFGVEIRKVREIVGFMNIAPVSNSPPHVKGVIHLHGRVVSVIDVRGKLGMEPSPTTDDSCILIVEVCAGDQTTSAGVIVDRVTEVLTVAAESLLPAASLRSGLSPDCVIGVSKIGETVRVLLDIDRLVGADVLGNAPMNTSNTRAA